MAREPHGPATCHMIIEVLVRGLIRELVGTCHPINLLRFLNHSNLCRLLPFFSPKVFANTCPRTKGTCLKKTIRMFRSCLSGWFPITLHGTYFILSSVGSCGHLLQESC